MQPILKFQAVSKNIKNKPVLKSVDFAISANEFVALSGPRGSGKTTLLAVAQGRMRADAGEIEIFGRPLSEHLRFPCYRVSFVSEIVTPMPLAMHMVAKLQSQLNDMWDQDLVLTLAEKFGLDLTVAWTRVSRGQQLAFAFILAIATKPEFLFVDDIISEMDGKTRRVLIEELDSFSRDGRAAILVTNDLSDAQLYVDRLILLKDGQVKVKVPVVRSASEKIPQLDQLDRRSA